MDRRDFLKASAGAVAVAGLANCASASGSAPEKTSEEDKVSTVYFTKDLSAAGVLKLYEKVKQNISGKVAIKLHTGEPNGPNIIPREWDEALQKAIPNSTIVETNTLYQGGRYTTADHRKALEVNGFTKFTVVDIMDEDGETPIPVKDGYWLKELHVGKHMLNYDSMVVFTHFKGHAMGGFGGSMKNIAIGCAGGQIGKREVHLNTSDVNASADWIMGAKFMELMGDSAKATCDHFKGKMCFINVLRRMSVDCDCAGTSAAEPTCRDIGILASTDILAVDQASIDMVYKLPPKELADLKERIESREGLHQLDAMEHHKMGNRKYKLVEVL